MKYLTPILAGFAALSASISPDPIVPNVSANTLNNIQTNDTTAKDWTKIVNLSSFGGYVMGNPNAETRIAEYISYTCPHCATFEMNSAPTIKNEHVKKGNVSYEIRNLVRDPIDFSIAILARCGGKDKFFSNHAMFMREQSNIIKRFQALSPDVAQDWRTDSITHYTRDLAKSLQLDTLLITNGFTAEQIEKCTADQQSQQYISQMLSHARFVQRVSSTPGFLINDEYLPAITGLNTLAPYL